MGSVVGGARKAPMGGASRDMEDKMLHSTHFDLSNKTLSELQALLVKAFNTAASAAPASRQARDAEVLKAAIRRELASRQPGF